MPYAAPTRDHTFLLKDVLQIERYANLPGFADASMDLVQQILEEGGRFAEEVIAPINRAGDREGCRLQDGEVTTPTGWKEAYRQMVEAGWTALSSDPAYGGQGMPAVVSFAISETTAAANPAFSMYPGLTHGAYAALHASASDEIKQRYLPKLVSGEWGGTMNLTEPQCGTDLGLIRTKAVPNGDGSYRISGQKIWISSGEHDFTDNIIHLVLARLEGAPAGVKGISLFVVPKVLVNEDGSLGERNGAKCAGLEHKMGIHGNATCVMAYDDAKGWLVGEENRGLQAMFVMMNEARWARACRGWRSPRPPIRRRRTSRASGCRDARSPDQEPRRSGRPHHRASGRAAHAAGKPRLRGGRPRLRALDRAAGRPAEVARRATRQKASDYMSLLTPVLKAYLTDRGFHVASQAMQVHGGSGYTEHFPASQYLRDARITMIYEGANGIQALDLVGRKLAANGGAAVMSFFADIDAFVAEAEGQAEIAPLVEGLRNSKAQLQEATFWLMQNGMQNPDNAGAASTDYLHLFGLTALAYMWALMAQAAQSKVAAGEADPFYAAKLTTARYYAERILPDASAHLAKLKTGAATLMEMPAEAF
jgi:alkylation response protein AidB-like acyl-CoA dehydrogenase